MFCQLHPPTLCKSLTLQRGEMGQERIDFIQEKAEVSHLSQVRVLGYGSLLGVMDT